MRTFFSSTRPLLFWAIALLLLPVLLLQGLHTRRTALRLPEASGSNRGQQGQGPQRHLLVIGESPVAGVGVQHHDQGLGPALARPLAEQLQCQLHWHCHGKNGLTLAQLLTHPLPSADQPYDWILVMMGVNDTTGLTALKHWQQQLQQLITRLTPHCHQLGFIGVPPVGQFTALPQPLRAVLGMRAQLLQQRLARVCAQQQLPLLPMSALSSPALLAEDGFHPSHAGFQALGKYLASQQPWS